jgi:signal transduction histidine kinase
MKVTEREMRILFLAPTLRDARVTAAIFAKAELPMTRCQNMVELCAETTAGAGAILLTEEALYRPDLAMLEDLLREQPSWSDLSVLILTRGGRDSQVAAHAMATMGNVTLIERPVRIPTLVSAAQSAVRSRLRQYQIRQHLEDHERAEQKLREADRRKDEFLAMLAHELRNPLSAIAMSVHLVRAPASPDQQQLAADVMEAQVGHLARMIDDLLDVSRITRQKITLRCERVDLTEVLLSAAATARPAVDERRHELVLDLAEGAFPTHADPTRLEQIFVNLLTNAAKFTEPGGKIEMISRATDAEFTVIVRDNGIGMPQMLLEGAFDLFVQGDRSIARSEGGLGIGLTLVRSLVALHGGTVTATSAGLGQGSEFVVTLPISQTQPPVPSDRSPPEPLQSGRSLRILVVDDKVEAALSLAELFQIYGHEVQVAYDGHQALERCREMKPEVILLDIGLPGMDGYEVAKTLRMEGFDDLLLIAVSGYREDEKSKAAGFDHHLVKPMKFDVLRALIAERG